MTRRLAILALTLGSLLPATRMPEPCDAPAAVARAEMPCIECCGLVQARVPVGALALAHGTRTAATASCRAFLAPMRPGAWLEPVVPLANGYPRTEAVTLPMRC